jgi:hypothetical protein
MSGDYSRNRFDPRADFAAVLMQQGRVQLDSDWNELVDILDRRLRAQIVDLVSDGQHNPGVAVVPRETPDGFKVLAGGGKLTIGRGRMYVDGLLAENHGGGNAEFDPVLGETRGKTAVGYDEQPYHPSPAALPSTGTHLAYLEVWQREVTHLEQPAIVEPAVGVDTTTRMQTVWQVRLLANVGGGITCATPDSAIPGWLALTAPSAGGLSSKAIGVKPQDDPCELPPSGGYRGLENQLYRVEIHDGGPIGQATFKWSRDNASVASAVAEIVSATELKLASLGRDAVLRFNSDDWVEIIDDARELSGESSDPARRRGELRKITVDDSKQTIAFAPALPADLTQGGTAVALQRHLRVRRWDQKGKVRDDKDNVLTDLDAAGSTGAIKIPATGTPVMLENGVQISFTVDTAGGMFRAGDYWLFAARTATADVEQLDQAPPRGVHRHYARLGLVAFPDSETDCRRLWPPQAEGAGCECTVCVTPESHASGALTIQKAVDQVKAVGGTVCLGAGVYVLGDAPIKIEDAQSLRLKGQGWRTILTASGPALRIAGCAGVTVEEMAMVSAGAGEEAALTAVNCLDVRLQRLTMIVFAGRDLVSPAIGLAGTLISTQVRDNTIVAPIGIAAGTVNAQKRTYLATVVLRIEDNALWCQRRAVSLDGLCFHLAETRLRGNNVLGCSQIAIGLTGAVAPGFAPDVGHNTLWVSGDAIVAGVDGVRIEANGISQLGAAAGRDGVVLAPGLDATGMDRCQVLDNRVVGLSGAGIAVRTRIRSAMIKGNIIERTGEGIVFEDKGAADAIAVENNQLIDIASAANSPDAAPVGVRVINARSAAIVGNTVRGLGQQAVQALARAGLQAVGCAQVRIAGNDVTAIGPVQDFAATAAGIEIVRPFDRVDVNDNIVRRDAVASTASGKAAWRALAIHAIQEAPVRRLSQNVTTIRIDDANHLVLTGLWAFVLALGAEVASVRGNLLEARGGESVALIAGRGDCLFGDNHCRQLIPSGAPAVHIAATTLIANANRVVGGQIGMALEVDPKRVTVLANVVGAGIFFGTSPTSGAPLGAPWAPLNINA